MKLTKLIFLGLLPTMVLFGCTQTELGAHVGKQIYSDSQSQGTFKVGNPYSIKSVRYTPKETYYHEETGTASWYGPGFHGKKTANGEIFNKYELTAAHRTLQMPSLIEVTNLQNGKSIVLRVNDRGPFAHNRILDVSERAAELLGFKNNGVTKIRLKVLAEESKQIADIAKQGKTTRGMETAYNQAGRATTQPAAHAGKMVPPQPTQLASAKVPSVQQETLNDPLVVGKYDNSGRFMPDPIVKNTLNPTGDIFIQAGSFGNPNNARSLSGQLGAIAPSNVIPVDVEGSIFHRVRLGPFIDMAQAQSALTKVAATGQSSAIIVVE